MLRFGAKNAKTHFLKKKTSLTKDQSVHCVHVNSYNFWRDRFFCEFIKNRIFRKLTTGLENRTKRQTDTKACVFLDLGFILQSKFSQFCNPFRTLPVWAQNIENSIARYSHEKNIIPENVIKSLYYWFKSTENFKIIGLVVLSTQLNEEMHSRFHTACNGAFRAQTFVPLCKRHFWSEPSISEFGNIFGEPSRSHAHNELVENLVKENFVLKKCVFTGFFFFAPKIKYNQIAALKLW